MRIVKTTRLKNIKYKSASNPVYDAMEHKWKTMKKKMGKLFQWSAKCFIICDVERKFFHTGELVSFSVNFMWEELPGDGGASEV